jgi:hypothetical protein
MTTLSGYPKPAAVTVSLDTFSTRWVKVPSASGVDQTGWNITGDESWTAHARNFALLSPMDREIAQLQFGHLKAAMEEPGQPSQEIDLRSWQATISYGFPQQDVGRPPGTKDAHGGVLIAQLGPDEFLVTGIDASVVFH